jgi:hypothetical protein
MRLFGLLGLVLLCLSCGTTTSAPVVAPNLTPTLTPDRHSGPQEGVRAFSVPISERRMVNCAGDKDLVGDEVNIIGPSGFVLENAKVLHTSGDPGDVLTVVVEDPLAQGGMLTAPGPGEYELICS